MQEVSGVQRGWGVWEGGWEREEGWTLTCQGAGLERSSSCAGGTRPWGGSTELGLRRSGHCGLRSSFSSPVPTCTHMHTHARAPHSHTHTHTISCHCPRRPPPRSCKECKECDAADKECYNENRRRIGYLVYNASELKPFNLSSYS